MTSPTAFHSKRTQFSSSRWSFSDQSNNNTGLNTPIKTFFDHRRSNLCGYTKAQSEQLFKIRKKSERLSELQQIIPKALKKNKKAKQNSASKAHLPGFMVSEFCMVTRKRYHTSEKLGLRCRCAGRVINAMNDYVYKIEELRNEVTAKVRALRLKFYLGESLNKE